MPGKRITFSFCISFFKTEILIFISSISCSGRTWMLGQVSESSRVWKVKSARGMYHLHSYCWWRLQGDRERMGGCKNGNGRDETELVKILKKKKFLFFNHDWTEWTHKTEANRFTMWSHTNKCYTSLFKRVLICPHFFIAHSFKVTLIKMMNAQHYFHRGRGH